MKNKVYLAWLTLALASAAGAQDIYLGEPGYNGSGCPTGTAAVTLSPDAKTLTILFQDYAAEAGGITGRRVDRRNCNIAVPVHVPQGYSVSVFSVDYRGFTSVPRGGYAQFDAEYFFAGGTGPRTSRRFNGAMDNDYLITNRLLAESIVWSRCGAQAILRANTSMRAVSNSRMDQTLAIVDSADIQAGLIYHLQWRRCSLPE